MIKSMTGFGRCEIQQDSKKFTVELKSVNHRYLDVNIRMPKKLNFFETSIRTLLKSYANRGKVDIFITYEDLSQAQSSVKYNPLIAAEYMKYFKQMEEEFGLENDISVSALARFPEVLTMEEQVEDEEELWNGLKKALEGAFTQFVETRITEGENLKKDIICTDEEVVRLKSHIQHMRATLEEKEGIGRKLDFIAQEMNREANTILSKANDIEVSNHAISLKTEIEKIREQIQNIE